MGLELVEAFDFDLILFSAQLPHLNGIALCEKLRSMGKQVAIINTATAQDNDRRVAALDAGADDFIDKDHSPARTARPHPRPPAARIQYPHAHSGMAAGVHGHWLLPGELSRSTHCPHP